MPRRGREQATALSPRETPARCRGGGGCVDSAAEGQRGRRLGALDKPVMVVEERDLSQAVDLPQRQVTDQVHQFGHVGFSVESWADASLFSKTSRRLSSVADFRSRVM